MKKITTDFKKLYNDWSENLEKLIKAYEEAASFKSDEEISLKLDILGLTDPTFKRKQMTEKEYSEYYSTIAKIKQLLKTKAVDITDDDLDFLKVNAEEVDKFLSRMSSKFSQIKKNKKGFDFYIPDSDDLTGDIAPGTINKLLEDLTKAESGKWKAFPIERYEATKKAALSDSEFIDNWYNSELPNRLNFYCNKLLQTSISNKEQVMDLQVDKLWARETANEAALDLFMSKVNIPKEVLLKYLEYTFTDSLTKLSEEKQRAIITKMSEIKDLISKSGILEEFARPFTSPQLIDNYVGDGNKSDKTIYGANKISPSTYAFRANNKINSVLKWRAEQASK